MTHSPLQNYYKNFKPNIIMEQGKIKVMAFLKNNYFKIYIKYGSGFWTACYLRA